jgi:hypothetical protein
VNLVQHQIALSTAEEEQNYFTGPTSRGPAPPAPHQNATGTYRVVDGQLYLIVPGAPVVPPVVPPAAAADEVLPTPASRL